MAIGKTAACIALALACQAAQFTVRHPHRPWKSACTGLLTVDAAGVSFSGDKDHSWTWKYDDIQQLALTTDSIEIRTYRDRKLHLGADQSYDFKGEVPAESLYPDLRDHLDTRLVAAFGEAPDGASWSVPVKRLGTITGSEGTLAFAGDAIVYSAPNAGASRTWRYSDIDNIASSGRYELTITTPERAFHFQLKQPITESRYNDLWLTIEKKNGRIQ
jgi:hypothetical protein